MKLSQFPTDRAADVICEITPYATDILACGEIKEKLKKASNGKFDKMTMAQKISFGAGVINEFVPYLLKEKKDAVFHIIAALNEKTVEEIKAQKFGETCKQVKEIAQDEELIELFS